MAGRNRGSPAPAPHGQAAASRPRALARAPASLTALRIRQARPREGACCIGKYSRKVKKLTEEVPTLQGRRTSLVSYTPARAS